MTPARIFRECRSEPGFLLRHYASEWVALSTAIAVVFSSHVHDYTHLELGGAHLALALLAIPVGWRMASLLHNAGHGNFGHPWVNRVIGEFSATYLGYGFANFVLIHTLHHAHTDQEHDPVSPRDKTFVEFLFSPMRDATRRARRYLLELHGGTPRYEALRWGEVVLFHVNLALRGALWFVLLGPELFVAFYIPSIVSNVAILAHINYVCHRDRDDGSIEIVNHRDKLYYRIANFVTVGGYFHKNHHLRPRLYDPRVMEDSDEPESTRESEPRETIASRAARGGFIKRYFDVAGIWGERKA